MMPMPKNKPNWPQANASNLIARKILCIGDGYRAKNSEMGLTGLPFARAGNINGGFLFDGADLLDDKNVPKAGDKTARCGDIVFTSKGTVGRFAFVGPKTQNFVYSPQLCYWRILDSSVLEPRFVFYWMQSSEFLSQVHQVKGLTDMADYVSLSDQRRMNLTVPPLTVQCRIASILSAYDDLIENNTRRIKILEEMAQMLYREWFCNFRFPGHKNVEPAQSELGPIPKGWKVARIVEFGTVVTGKTPSKGQPDFFGTDVPFIKLPDMHGNVFVLDTNEHLSFLGQANQAKKTIPANSLCVSCIGTAGIVVIPTRPSQTNQQINSVVLNSHSDREFLYFRLMDLKETINQYGANGATMINLNKTKFENLCILKPECGLVSRFHDVAMPLFEQIKNLQQRNKNLRKTRDFLLPKLISGEVSVEAAEESA
jgi:type I restriction enzyme, S subunit